MDFSEFIKKIKVSDRWLAVDFLAICVTAVSYAHHRVDTNTLIGVGAIAALTVASNHFYKKENKELKLTSCKNLADSYEKKGVSVKDSKKFWLVYDRENDSWSKKSETEYKIWKKAICENTNEKKPIMEFDIDEYKSFIDIFECRDIPPRGKHVGIDDDYEHVGINDDCEYGGRDNGFVGNPLSP